MQSVEPGGAVRLRVEGGGRGRGERDGTEGAGCTLSSKDVP